MYTMNKIYYLVIATKSTVKKSQDNLKLIVSMFMFKMFFTFNHSCYDLMVSDISRRQISWTVGSLRPMVTLSTDLSNANYYWEKNDPQVLKSNSQSYCISCIEQWIETLQMYMLKCISTSRYNAYLEDELFHGFEGLGCIC